MGLMDFFGGGQQPQQLPPATNVKVPKDPGTLYRAKTAPFDPKANNYPGMPTSVTVPAYMPGQQAGLLGALAQGFGGDPAQYASPLFQPQTYSMLTEPLTTTMRAFGTEVKGPGVIGPIDDKKGKGFNPRGYNQWGQDTGSPYLNYAFGLKRKEGVYDPTKNPNNNPNGGKKGGGNNNNNRFSFDPNNPQQGYGQPQVSNPLLTPYQRRMNGGWL